MTTTEHNITWHDPDTYVLGERGNCVMADRTGTTITLTVWQDYQSRRHTLDALTARQLAQQLERVARAAEAAREPDYAMITEHGNLLVHLVVNDALTRQWPLGTGLTDVVAWVRHQVRQRGGASVSEVDDTAVGDAIASTVHAFNPNL